MASLMSKSCRASALLSGARENVVDGCYQFGRNLGTASRLLMILTTMRNLTALVLLLVIQLQSVL